MAACGMELRRSVRKQEKVQEKGTSLATVKTVQLRSRRGNGSVAGQFTRSGGRRSKKETNYKESSSSSSSSESETMETPVQRTRSKSHMDKATTSHRKNILGAGDVVKLLSTADLSGSSSDSSDDGIMEAMWLLSGKDKTSSGQGQGGKRDAEQKSEECTRKRRGCVVKAKHFTFKRLRNCTILEKQESNSKIDNTVPRLEKEVQKEEEEEEEEEEETGSELSEDSIEEEETKEEEETGSGELSEDSIGEEEEEKEEETGGRELSEECIEEEEKEKEVEVKEHVCVWSEREELSSMLPGRQAQVRILLELIGEVLNMVQSQKHVVMCRFVPFPFTVMGLFFKGFKFCEL